MRQTTPADCWMPGRRVDGALARGSVVEQCSRLLCAPQKDQDAGGNKGSSGERGQGGGAIQRRRTVIQTADLDVSRVAPEAEAKTLEGYQVVRLQIVVSCDFSVSLQICMHCAVLLTYPGAYTSITLSIVNSTLR